MQVDILAFGVHPDDVELGCGGTIAAAVAQGKKVGIVDLTQGELGTRGTIETRYAEAAEAAKILGVSSRENLQMADGFFTVDKPHILQVITAIRKYKPTIILCNAPTDRHPDHGRSYQLVKEAAFLSGLRKIETVDEKGNVQEAFKPSYVFSYIQDKYLEPDFLIDISGFYPQKQAAILSYATQFFNPNVKEPNTYISSPNYLKTVEGRALLLGKRIGVTHAEGFLSEKMLGIKSFDQFICNPT